ncbi:conserved hypothetical protein [Alteromonas macleodii]
MSIIRVQSVIEKYRELAKSESLHALSGRADRSDITAFISDYIYANLSINDGESLVDIGCGDGTFLSKFIDRNVNAIGILPTNEEVLRVQEKFSRIAKPGAEIYIGELAFKNEMEGKNYGNSILGWLVWVLRHQGAKAFIKRFNEVVKAVFTKEPFIIADKKHFYVREDIFIKWAIACGLEIVKHQKSKTLINSQICDSDSRYDYVFRKL